MPASRARWIATALVVGWLAVMAGAGWLLGSSQATSRAEVAGRMQTRTEFAAGFVSIYARGVVNRVQAQARSWFSAKRVDPSMVARAASGLQLRGAALLDARGKVIGVAPSQSPKLTLALLSRYADIGARGGWARAGVSSVGVSMIDGTPVLSFAASFQSAAGVRVFAGAYDVADTMLSLVLEHLISSRGWSAYVVGDGGALLAAVHSPHANAGSLAQADPALWAADKSASSGSYRTPQGSQDYFTAAIPGTTWRVVVTDPDSELYGFLDGTGRWLAWLALAGLTIAGLAIITLIAGLQRGRRRLTAMNAELTGLAAVDALTGLSNRRAIEEHLHDALSGARRHGQALSVLVLDVDHFKNFNDTLGHRSGDTILAHTAQVLDGALRAEDSIGRWGGEEFLVVLPETDELGALHATERLRDALAADQPEEARSRGLAVTITIGVAEWQQEEMDELVTRADSALYLGKAAGRDTVQVSTPIDGVAEAPELA
jgi:diguanylate cyclase (GGDEF)-like protein